MDCLEPVCRYSMVSGLHGKGISDPLAPVWTLQNQFKVEVRDFNECLFSKIVEKNCRMRQRFFVYLHPCMSKLF